MAAGPEPARLFRSVLDTHLYFGRRGFQVYDRGCLYIYPPLTEAGA